MKKNLLNKMSPRLRKLMEANKDSLIPVVKNKGSPVSQFAQKTLKHANGGATLEAAFWLRNHLNKGGKLVISLAGALSSFQIGITLAELIRKDKVHLISATGANHEESYFRYVAHSHFAHIPRYTELTPEQERELRDLGLRRITDTFLPEYESVRLIEPHLVNMWKKAMKEGKRYFPHEYFRELFAKKLITPDSKTDPKHEWAYAAYQKDIPIVIPGFEDSTIGNIFASYTYNGPLKKKKQQLIDQSVLKTGIEYFHLLYDWYVKTSKKHPIAFLQLGGGISGDFPICVVPSLKHDLKLHQLKDWAGFIEIGSSPMSYGSYSGAGGKEKITWDKLSSESYYKVIQSDVTVVFPWIAAILLDH